MTRADGSLVSVALVSCCAVGLLGACASLVGSDPAHHSTVPVFTKGTPLSPPDLPGGWSVGGPLTREGLAKTETLDTPTLANLGQLHRTRLAELRFVKLAKDATGRWTTSDSGDLKDPNVEEIWVDAKDRRVGPAVEANIYCHGVDPARRAVVGYMACTSNFAAPYDQGGRYWVNIDEHALGEAVKQAGLLPKLEAEEVAAREAAVANQKAEDAAAVEREKKERVEQVERAKQRDKERAALQLAAERFRQSLAVGAATHCGMVIEVKRPIVKVQTMDGEKWLRVEQIYPPNSAPCRFFNHVYQDP